MTQLIIRDYDACGVSLDEYSKKCAMEAMTSIYTLVKTNPKVNMQTLDTSNLRSIIEYCASHKLNASARPRECYFQLRNVKVGVDENNKDVWQQMIEVGIEGAGYDAELSHFGKDVDRVYPFWVIHEGDKYIPPKHKGLEVTPPEWEETGKSQRVVRVVYPVKLTDGTVTYLTAERESAKVNLFAHVRQNLLNETFGIIQGTVKKYGKEVERTRYDATDDEKKKIKAEKEKIYAELSKCKTIDEMFACEIARPYISGAWLDTPESMIARKLCNNATKNFPKSMDAMARQTSAQIDDVYVESQVEIVENANTVDFEESADQELVEPEQVDNVAKNAPF